MNDYTEFVAFLNDFMLARLEQDNYNNMLPFRYFRAYETVVNIDGHLIMLQMRKGRARINLDVWHDRINGTVVNADWIELANNIYMDFITEFTESLENTNHVLCYHSLELTPIIYDPNNFSPVKGIIYKMTIIDGSFLPTTIHQILKPKLFKLHKN